MQFNVVPRTAERRRRQGDDVEAQTRSARLRVANGVSGREARGVVGAMTCKCMSPSRLMPQRRGGVPVVVGHEAVRRGGSVFIRRGRAN